MRKFLFAVLAILILVLVFFLVRDGLSIGKINILGVTEIQALNGQVDQKIAEAFEYLKCLPLEVQKEVALEIINLLQEEEVK